LLLAAVAVPLSFLFDFSWENTIGIDRTWAPPHVLTYAAVALTAAMAVLSMALRPREGGVRLWRLSAPLGAWIALWGSVASLAGILFGQWWQSAYGMAAGIWHPPQLLLTVGILSILAGTWIHGAEWQKSGGSSVPFLVAGGALAAMLSLVMGMFTLATLPDMYANRQHSGPFYAVACSIFPVVFVALSVAGKSRFSATLAALVYTVLVASTVWLLPLVPAQPKVGPIYQPMTHLLPPPFPLLLIAPALGLDVLVRVLGGRKFGGGWGNAVELGLAFFAIFVAVQWFFSGFLLSPAADNAFFAGGGQHWPFFLKIDEASKRTFWELKGEEFNNMAAVRCALLAMLSAHIGLWLGTRMKGGHS
jgi:hypothetical protein